MLLNKINSDIYPSLIIKNAEEMNLSLFITDIDGKIIFVNKAFSNLTEFSQEELINQNPRIFKSNYHDKNFYQILWDTILSGNTWRGELFNKTKTGKLIWNRTIISPIKNKDNKVIYFFSIRENINIQKEFNNFININSNSFDNSPIVLFNCNTKNLETNYISRNIKNILNYEVSDFLEKKIKISSIIHKDDFKKLKSEMKFSINHLKLDNISIKFRAISKDNKIKYFSGKVNIFKDSKNKIINYNGYLLDNTKQKELENKLCLSENKFEIALDSVGYGIWDWNTLTGKVFYSKSWKEMLGYDKSTELNSVNTWKDSIHPLDKERVLNYTQKLLNNEITIYEEEYRLKTKEGRYKWILSKGKVLEWKENKAIRLIGTHIDLTEIKLKEEYKYKTKNLESLGRLAGNIAHNFNNILMSIQGNIELLKNDINDKNEHIKNIENSIVRAKKISKKMLIFAKGGDPIKNRVNNIDKIIIKRIDSLLFVYKDKYKFSAEIEKNLLTVDIDINLFTEAIDNIILNSIESMPNGGTIKLKLKNTLKNSDSISQKHKNYLCISILDTGYGIKEKIINKIFEPFFTTKPHEKEGVGLTAANAIITKHDGKILITSIENQGTEVKIYLKGYPNMIKTKIKNKKLKTQKILIMDDEEIILKILKRFLNKSGYTVDTSINGEETIKKYIKAQEMNSPYDAVIMDLIIANGMNGEETIYKLLKIDENAKVIASSGYSNNKIMSNYQDYGFKAILPKPYKLNKLTDLIDTL